MDILIDLIIYLIKQAGKSGDARRGVPPPLPAQRVAQPLPPQAQSMQRALAAQAARTRPATARAGATRGAPASWAQPAVRAAAPPVNQPPVATITPDAGSPRRPAASSRAIPGLKLPFLLGEVLSRPVALRDEGF